MQTMKTVKSKTLYEVFGHAFTDKTKAEAAEQLLNAKRAYEDARGRYGKLLAETFKTADGRSFKWCEHYWWITSPCNALPLKIRVWCYPGSTAVDLEDHKENVSLSVYCDTDHYGNDRKMDPVKVPIDELYSDDAKVDAALYKAQVEWLDNMRKNLKLQAQTRKMRP
jgi:hypothetical protein